MNKKLKLRIIELFGTQADFAQVIDTDETLVSRVIRGRRKLNRSIQQKWADKLRCKPEDVFTHEG